MCLEDGAAFALLDGRWRWLRLGGRFRVYPVDDESHDVQSEVHAVWLGVEEAAVVQDQLIGAGAAQWDRLGADDVDI